RRSTWSLSNGRRICLRLAQVEDLTLLLVQHRRVVRFGLAEPLGGFGDRQAGVVADDRALAGDVRADVWLHVLGRTGEQTLQGVHSLGVLLLLDQRGDAAVVLARGGGDAAGVVVVEVKRHTGD